MIRVIAGIDTLNKEKHLAGKILEDDALQEGPVFVIVPEQYTLNMEKQLLDILDLKGMMGIEVMSFSRLIAKVTDNLNLRDQIPLTALGRKLLIKRIIQKKTRELKVYYKSGDKFGLIDEFEELVSSLREERISSSDLRAFKDRLPEGVYLRHKIEDLLLVYQAYEEEVAGGFLDEFLRDQLFFENLDLIHHLEEARVYILKFSGFSKRELDFITTLEASTRGVTIGLDYYQAYQEGVMDFTRDTLDRLRRVFPALILEEFTEPPSPWMNYALALGGYRQPTFEVPLRVAASENLYAECEFVVSEIHRLIREEGVAPGDIGVMLTDFEGYHGVITREFRRYQIPLIVDEKRSIKDTSLVNAIMALLKFYERNFESAYLFEYLKLTVSLERMHLVDTLENWVLERGIDHEEWLEPYEEEALEDLRVRMIKPLMAQKKSFKGRMKIEDFTRALMGLLKTLKIRELVEEEKTFSKAHDRFDEILITTQAWNAFLQILDQIALATGDSGVTLKDFIEYLRFALEDEKVGIIPSVSNGVEVGVLGRTVPASKSHLFLLGMVEGNLPKDPTRSSLLSETDKAQFMAHGFDLHNDAVFYQKKEIYDITALFCKSVGEITATYTRSDLDGQTLKPSFYIERLLSLAASPVRLSATEIEGKYTRNLLLHRESLKINTIRVLREIREGRRVPALWGGILWALYHKDPETYSEALKRVFYSNQADPISVYAHRQVLKTSITQLEKYAQCPFSHYARYNLRLKERREFKVRMPDLGNVYHEVFQRAIGDLIEKRPLKGIPDYLEEVLADPRYRMFKKKNANQYLVKKTSAVSQRVLENLIAYYDRSEFKPLLVEMPFEEEGEFKPVTIDIGDNRTVMIQGKIDRVDLYRDSGGKSYCNIVDYKSGTKGLSLGRVVKGTEFQLAVYLLASLINAGTITRGELLPSGVFYYPLKEVFEEMGGKSEEEMKAVDENRFRMEGLLLDDLTVLGKMDLDLEETKKSRFLPVALKKDMTLTSRSTALSREGFDRLLEITRENIRQTGRSILEGDHRVAPLESGQNRACQYCDYASVCKFDPRFKDNDYRSEDFPSNDDVLKALRGEEE